MHVGLVTQLVFRGQSYELVLLHSNDGKVLQGFRNCCWQKYGCSLSVAFLNNLIYVFSVLSLHEVVCLVQDQKLKRFELELCGQHELQKSSWSCNDNVWVDGQGLKLACVVMASNYQGVAQVRVPYELLEYLGCLKSKLSCWNQNQGSYSYLLKLLFEHR